MAEDPRAQGGASKDLPVPVGGAPVEPRAQGGASEDLPVPASEAPVEPRAQSGASKDLPVPAGGAPVEPRAQGGASEDLPVPAGEAPVEPAPAPAPPRVRPTVAAIRRRARAARDAFVDARFELTWILYGAALLLLTTYNEHHGLALSTALPGLGLDLGLVWVAAGAFLLFTRGPAPSAPAPGADWAARVGAGLLVFGLGAEGLSHATGAFSSLTAGGVFLPDVGILVGGLLFALRVSRPVLPSGIVWRASLIALAGGTLFALVHNYLLRLPYAEVHRASLEGGAGLTALAAPGAILNPLAPAVAAGQGAADLLRLARARDLGLAAPPEILAWLAGLALFGLVGLVWAALRRAPATSAGERRPGPAALVLVAGGLLYLPTLGAFALYDPWEGHYAEVARQMIARGDWVSQYWYDNWFWSKPVGAFWMMATSFKLFGISDLTARLPFALTGIAGLYFVYYFCRKLWSVRAGVIAAIALACFPQYLLVSRQVMTDIPVVVLTTMAMGFLILALFAKDEDDIERLPLTIAFVAVFAATTLPQYGMLASELRRFGLLHAFAYLALWVGLLLALLRGRKARQIYAYSFYLCVALGCLAKGLIAPGLPAIVLFTYLLISGEWGDFLRPRRAGLMLLVAAAVFGAAALIFKVGFGVPGTKILLTALLFAVGVAIVAGAATARGGAWDRLEVGKGLAIMALAGLPWYVAMAARHGGIDLDANATGGIRFTGFLHEFLVQHHFDRLGGGVHGDTNTTFEYFVRWGAYALFPWVAFVPAALARFWNGGGRVKLFVFLWFAAFATLFTLSATKFHHYILPALPPLAVMIGFWLDRAADDEAEIGHAALAGAIAILAFVAWDLVRWPQTFYNSFTYVFSGRSYPWPTTVMPEPFLRIFALSLGAVLLCGLVPRPRSETTSRNVATVWALAFLALGVLAILWSASPIAPKLMSIPPERVGDWREALALAMPMPPPPMITDYVQNAPVSGFWAMAGKVTGRIGDYGFGMVAAFAAVVAVASVYFAGRRRAVMALFAGLTFVFGLWCAHVYMVELGPHSGQRHLFEVYYARRAGPQERICAYMMNWRSEHWYTFNQVTVALNDGKLLEHARRPGRQWLVTERARIGDVRNLLNVRNQICRKVVEWDLWSNRYVLATLEDDPADPEVQQCLQKRGGRSGAEVTP